MMMNETALLLNMTAENYNFSMAICGIVSAFVIFIIWSKAL